jgi:glycosyltransferase involved in cell wall biosynthesis
MRRPRTVLYVDFHTTLGGGQVVLLNTFKALDRRRYRPVLALPDDGPFAQAARDAGVPVFISPMGKARWRLPWQAWPAARRLERLLRAEGVDLVHANNYPANKLAVVAARRVGIPCLWHKHILAKRRGSSTAKLWAFYARFNAVVLGASHTVAASLRDMGLPAGKVRALQNGVDVAAIQRSARLSPAAFKKAGLPSGAPVLGVVAQHRTHKGIDLFLEAAILAAAQDKRAHFVVIGDPQNAEEAMERRIRALAADPRLKGRVHLLPAQRQAPAWMRRFSVLVSPSRWEVGAPLVPMEAMALGVPVLATDKSSGELISDGKDGLLVPAGDVAALAAGMLRLLKDRALARRLGAAGRRTVTGRFSLKRYSLGLMELYDELLAGRP